MNILSTLKRIAVSSAIALALAFPASAEWIRVDDSEVVSAIRPLQFSWVNIMANSNIRNFDGDVMVTTTGTNLLTATMQIKMQDGHNWVEVEFTIPGSLDTYVGYVHESRVESFYFADRVNWH